MKSKKFTTGITFFAELKMYQELKEVSDELGIALSELIRVAADNFLREYQIKKETGNE